MANTALSCVKKQNYTVQQTAWEAIGSHPFWVLFILAIPKIINIHLNL